MRGYDLFPFEGLDPWVRAQFAMGEDPKLRPLIEVETRLVHPVAVAKKIVTLSRLYPHDFGILLSGAGELGEFAAVLRELLSAKTPVFRESGIYPLQGIELWPVCERRVPLFMRNSSSEIVEFPIPS